MKVWKVIHTTCGVEHEIVPDKDGEPDLEKSLTGRWFVRDDEDDEFYDEGEAEREYRWTLRLCAKNGWEIVGEAWS